MTSEERKSTGGGANDRKDFETETARKELIVSEKTQEVSDKQFKPVTPDNKTKATKGLETPWPTESKTKEAQADCIDKEELSEKVNVVAVLSESDTDKENPSLCNTVIDASDDTTDQFLETVDEIESEVEVVSAVRYCITLN